MDKIDSQAAAHGVALDAHRRAIEELAQTTEKPNDRDRAAMDSSRDRAYRRKSN